MTCSWLRLRSTKCSLSQNRRCVRLRRVHGARGCARVYLRWGADIINMRRKTLPWSHGRVLVRPHPSWRLEGGACVMTEVGEGMVGCSAS